MGFQVKGVERGGGGERGEGPPLSSAMTAAGGEKVMGNQHPLEQNHVISSPIGNVHYLGEFHSLISNAGA